MCMKALLLYFGEILGVLRHTLTPNDTYSLRNYDKMWPPIQIQLSLKSKNFPHSFVPFLEPTSNFKYFEKKDDRHSYFF